MDRHEEKIKRDFSRAGAVAAAIYNVNLKKGSRSLGAADIFPSLHKRAIPREATEAEIKAMFGAMSKNFNKSSGADAPKIKASKSEFLGLLN